MPSLMRLILAAAAPSGTLLLVRDFNTTHGIIIMKINHNGERITATQFAAKLTKEDLWLHLRVLSWRR